MIETAEYLQSKLQTMDFWFQRTMMSFSSYHPSFPNTQITMELKLLRK